MNCATCKLKKIGPNIAPHGGYLCANEHLQCNECNVNASGHCGVCDGNTSFVQMNFNNNNNSVEVTSMKTTAAAAAQQNVMVPSAPPLEVIESKAADVNVVNALAPFPKDLFEQLETQSSLSQEEISMHESHELISLGGGSQHTPLAPLLEKDRQPMETIYVGQRTQPKSMSNFTFQERLDTATANASQPKAVTSAPMTPLRKGSSGTSKRRSSENRITRKNLLNDFEDPDIIHTSELRFIESTESLKNYYSGGTMQQPPAEARDDHKSTDNTESISTNKAVQESLSTKALHDFESQNCAQPAELVENYLRSYGQVTVCNYPAYAYHHHHHHSAACYHTHHCQMWNQQTQVPTCSISVSTESDPKLLTAAAAPATDEAAKMQPPANMYKPQGFIVMHAAGVTRPVATSPNENLLPAAPSTQKTATPSIDIRMQKVLETFTEEPRQKPLTEKPLLTSAKNLMKLPTSSSASESAKSHAQGDGPNVMRKPADVEIDGVDLEAPGADVEAGFTSDGTEKETPSDLAARLSNSHRAYYNPPATPVRALRGNNLEPVIDQPLPQFQLITCSSLVANEFAMARARFLDLRPIPACHLNIPRAPIQCPESTCRRMIFVSDFNKHLIVDHSNLPMERIATRQCKNFFLDPRVSHKGLSKCHMLYLIRDKISDLGSSKFKDFLPLLVMSTRINLSDLLGVPATLLGDENIDFLMVWLTGIAPEEFPVSVSLTVWSRAGPTPVCHIVQSGRMYSIRQSPNHGDICRSGQTLLLAASEVHLLTKGGRDMLELQLVVH